MMTPLTLPVALPFEVRTAPLPLLSSEQPLRLRIDLNQPLSDVIESRINAALETFERFSKSGALDLAPEEIPGIEFDGPQPADQVLAWEISAPPMDERTIVVLLNILLELADVTAFRSINLVPPEYPGILSPIAVDSTIAHPYPTQQSDPPFKFEHDTMIYDEASVWIAFESTPSDDAKAEIDTLLTCWRMGMDAGAYRLTTDWPQSPLGCEDEDESEFEADEAREWDEEEELIVAAGQAYLLAGKPTFVENEMTWDLEHCRFHSDAFGALVNVAMHIHHNLTPISQMNIEG